MPPWGCADRAPPLSEECYYLGYDLDKQHNKDLDKDAATRVFERAAIKELNHGTADQA